MRVAVVGAAGQLGRECVAAFEAAGYAVAGSDLPQVDLLRVVTDQRGSPTWARTLARQIVRLAEVDATGLYHAAGAGAATRYEFARAFLDALGIDRVVEPVTSEAFPVPARRPPNAALRNGRLDAKGLSVFPDWRKDLTEYASQTCVASLRH